MSDSAGTFLRIAPRRCSLHSIAKKIISLRCILINKKSTGLKPMPAYTLKTAHENLILQHLLNLYLGQAYDRLVTVSSMHYCTSTSVLSTSCSSRGLGISHLEGGFTLRCLQRLSLPDLATLPCGWYHNRYTSGPSTPVLSY